MDSQNIIVAVLVALLIVLIVKKIAESFKPDYLPGPASPFRRNWLTAIPFKPWEYKS